MRFGSTQDFCSLITFSSCASVNYYYKFEIPLISSIFYKWRLDCCILRFSQAAPLVGVHWTSLAKTCFCYYPYRRLCVHTHAQLWDWTLPSFLGRSLIFCCFAACVHMEILPTIEAIPFHYDSLSRIFLSVVSYLYWAPDWC